MALPREELREECPDNLSFFGTLLLLCGYKMDTGSEFDEEEDDDYDFCDPFHSDDEDDEDDDDFDSESCICHHDSCKSLCSHVIHAPLEMSSSNSQ